MKILKKGKVPTSVREIECRKCHSEIEFTADELEYVVDQRDGNFYWFMCPVCKERRAIAEHLIK